MVIEDGFSAEVSLDSSNPHSSRREMMRVNAMVRAAFLFGAAVSLSLSLADRALGQDVGSDVGGGAGIFRAKNPETTKKGSKPSATSKPGTRPAAKPNSHTAERV